jgi:ADP-ribose pyrophosphatase YjhB (NUDIX family)
MRSGDASGGRGVTSYHAADPTQIRLSVSAVVWRDAPGGELLLMRRSDNGCWGLPGGYVEPGERLLDAVAREVREETGAEIDVGELIGIYADPRLQVIAYPDGARVHAVNLCFEARLRGQGRPTTPEETLETRLFPASALPEPFVPIHEIRVRDAVGPRNGVKVR